MHASAAAIISSYFQNFRGLITKCLNSQMSSSSFLACKSRLRSTIRGQRAVLSQICCFGECKVDLTLIVLFRKIVFLVCCWKQIIISRSWNWTHLQFSTQCSNGCQCVLCNFQWFLFTIMSVTVLYLGGGHFFFGTQCRCAAEIWRDVVMFAVLSHRQTRWLTWVLNRTFRRSWWIFQ